MRVFDALRAMNAFVGDQDSGAITCHRCGAVVDDDAQAAQADSAGGPMLTRWYCQAHFVAGTRRLLAAIRAQRDGQQEGSAE